MHSHTGNVVSHCVLRNWTCSHKFWFFDNLSPVKRLISIFSSIHLLKCGSLMIWTYLFWNWTLWLLTEIPGSALLNLSLSIAFIIPAFIIHCLYYPLPLLSIAFIIHCLCYPMPFLSLSENVSVKYVNIFCETRTFYLKRQSSRLLDKSRFILGR